MAAPESPHSTLLGLGPGLIARVKTGASGELFQILFGQLQPRGGNVFLEMGQRGRAGEGTRTGE